MDYCVLTVITIATGTEERPPTRCSLRTMGLTAGSSTLLLLLVAQTLSLEAKKKLPCRQKLIPCPWLLSLSIQQDQSPGWTDHRLRGVMSLGNQMQFTLFNGDLFSKSAISQFLLGNILQHVKSVFSWTAFKWTKRLILPNVQIRDEDQKEEGRMMWSGEDLMTRRLPRWWTRLLLKISKKLLFFQGREEGANCLHK